MKISVVTVCFNSQKTIERTIQSVLNQSYPDFEYVIVDGGSTDDTLSILRKYSSKISKIVSEPDRGIYDAMNKGVGLSKGDFLHFLNSDDWYFSPMVLQNIACHLKDQELLYHGKLQYFHSDGRVSTLGYPVSKNDLTYELKGIYQPATFFPRSLFKQFGDFDLSFRISSDFDLIRRFAYQVRMDFIDETVTCMSDSGASSRQITRAIRENFQISTQGNKNLIGSVAYAIKTFVLLKLRYQCPKLFWILKKFKPY